MDIRNLTSVQLNRAADIKEEIQSLQDELAKIVGGEIPSPFVRKGKRRMSAAGRLAIAAAQKIRWAKHKAKSKPSGKRTLSAAAKAKIAAAAKKRWEKAKAAGKNSL